MNRPKFEDYRWKYTVSLNYDVLNYLSDMKIYCDKLEKINNELIKDKENYRWHNLRKDPNDLPKDDGEYFICYYWKNKRKKVKQQNSATFANGKFISIGDVVAWKHMEVFENE